MPLSPINNNSNDNWIHTEKNDKTRVAAKDFLFTIGPKKPVDYKIKPSPVQKRIREMIQTKIPDVSPEFVSGVIKCAKDINCKPEDLTTILYIESKFNPAAKKSLYHGLMQMNKTAFSLAKEYIKENPDKFKEMGDLTDFNSFCKKSREEQLPYIKAFLLNVKETYVKPKNKKLSGGELYALILAPGNYNNKYIIPKNSKTYNSNITLDIHKKDGGITKKDLQDFIDIKKINDLSQKLPEKI
ncbi:transglycosylase SLT domain-containing protein [bacterium]|nr:transglycosylase SLT domain-containing protein [bacterium]